MVAGRDLTWQEVYECWNFDCGNGAPGLLEPIVFEHIHVSGPIAEEIVDWCPLAAFEKQQVGVLKDHYGWYRDTNKGTLHTIELLWKYRENPEVTALVLLGAFLFENSRVYESRDDFGTFRMLEGAVRAEFRRIGLDWWHHLSTNSLPVPRSAPIRTEFYGQYVTAAVAASWLALTTWKPVVINQTISPAYLAVSRKR